MFIGGNDTQRAAGQALIEAMSHISRAGEALKRLAMLTEGVEKQTHENEFEDLEAMASTLYELHNDDCRKAFGEEKSHG